MNPRPLLRLIDSIYAAALGAGGWGTVTEQLAAFLEAPSATAILGRPETLAIEVLGHTANVDGAAKAAYAERFAMRDPWAIGYVAAGGNGIFLGDELIRGSEFARSEFYSDFSRRLGMFHFLGAAAETGAGTHLMLAAHRPANTPPFGGDAKHRLAQVLPHLARAMQVQRTLAEARLERFAACDALERLTLGSALLDLGGRLLFANAAAERHLRAGDALVIRHGRLFAQDPHAAAALAETIRTAGSTGAGRPCAVPTVVQAPRCDGRHALAILAVPLPKQLDAVLLGAAVMLFIADPEQKAAPSLAALTTLYRLTPAEGRLLQALSVGERIADYAERTAISLNTANTQLKQVFAKTGTSRQADLLALVLRDLALRLVNSTA